MEKQEFISEQVDVINKLVFPDGISVGHLQDIINIYNERFPPLLRVHNFSEMGSYVSFDTVDRLNWKIRMGARFTITKITCQ